MSNVYEGKYPKILTDDRQNGPINSTHPLSTEEYYDLMHHSHEGIGGEGGGVGPMGPTGPKGPAGAAGAAGPAGKDGNPGADGAVGPTGPTGPAGKDGAAGAPGDAGAVGPTGPTGPAGSNGNDGAIGPVGPTGPEGPAGKDGDAGAEGPVGPTGPAGKDGAAGVAGEAGAVGPTGPTGPAGPIGPNGKDGTAGTPGADGAVGPTGPTGPAGKDGIPGAEGPVGPTGPAPENAVTKEDLQTLEDKLDKSMLNKTPYVVAEKSRFFACGVHVTISEGSSEGKVKAEWYSATGNGELESQEFDENYSIIAGGDGSKCSCNYPATAITINGGKVKNVIAGNYGEGDIGSATVVVNGGNAAAIVGNIVYTSEDNKNKKATIGKVLIVINGGEINSVYGGCGSGIGSTGESEIIVNDGNIKFMTAAGSNGHHCRAKVTVNGGTIGGIQGVNRGTVDNVDFVVNGGTISKMWIGGEETEGVNATYARADVTLAGGTITTLSAGRNGAESNHDKVHGTYTEGVVDGDAATAAGLTKKQ